MTAVPAVITRRRSARGQPGTACVRAGARRRPTAPRAGAAGVLAALTLAGCLDAQGAPYRASWADVAVVGGAAVVAALPSLFELPKGAPPCAPCDPASLPAIDRWVVGFESGAADVASDVLVAGVVAGSVYWSVSGTSSERARGNLVVLGKSVAFTEVAVQWLKVATHRSRPVLYGDEAAAAAADPDSRTSFPSGHTAATFALATSYAVAAHRQHLAHATRNSAILYAAAVTIGALRVAAGKHFPTDVVAGAALGAGIGWLTVELHPTLP